MSLHYNILNTRFRQRNRQICVIHLQNLFIIFSRQRFKSLIVTHQEIKLLRSRNTSFYGNEELRFTLREGKVRALISYTQRPNNLLRRFVKGGYSNNSANDGLGLYRIRLT